MFAKKTNRKKNLPLFDSSLKLDAHYGDVYATAKILIFLANVLKYSAIFCVIACVLKY